MQRCDCFGLLAMTVKVFDLEEPRKDIWNSIFKWFWAVTHLSERDQIFTFAAVATVFIRLFPDAEIAEDSLQKLLAHCLAGDLTDGIEGSGDVYGDEIVGHLGPDTR